MGGYRRYAVEGLVALALIALAALAYLAVAQPARGEVDGVVIVVETEGLAEDLKLLACGSEEIVVLVPGGSDPHTSYITPMKALKLYEADLVFVVPDSPAGRRAAGIARGMVVEVSSIAEDLGVHGGHLPHYNPRVLGEVYKVLAQALGEVNPGCRGYYEARLVEVLQRLEMLEGLQGALKGMAAVADFNIYDGIAGWLGFRVEGYLAPSPQAQAPPKALAKLAHPPRGVELALILVDSKGEPTTRYGEALEDMAISEGLVVVRVEAPWSPKPTVVKLEEIADSIQAQANR